jgi:DnaJ-domain-containing protein 1
LHAGNCLVLGLIWFAQGGIAAQEAALAPALDPARALDAKDRALKAEVERSCEAEKAVCQNRAIAVGCRSAAKQRRIDTRRTAKAL